MAETQLTSPVIFGAVKDLLNEGVIAEAVDGISAAYSPENLKSNLPPIIDFSVEANRNAYVYKYFIALTRGVEHFLKEVDKINPLFGKMKTVNICSIGGGPGTEIFGLKLFLMSKNLDMFVRGTVLELYSNWEDIYKVLLKNLQFDDVEVVYKKFNFRKEINKDCIKAVRKADLVTLVKLVSNFPDMRDSEEKLAAFLRAMKPGAILLFIDNSGGNYFETMENAARLSRLLYITEFKYEEESYIPDEERKTMNAEYFGAKNSPQQTLRVSVSVWKMPTQSTRTLPQLS